MTYQVTIMGTIGWIKTVHLEATSLSDAKTRALELVGVPSAKVVKVEARA